MGQQPEKREISGKRVFLAEDNELSMETAQVLLQDAGAKVDTWQMDRRQV